MIARISLHAQERMERRGITLPVLAAVLVHGAVSPGREPGTYERELCGYRVVLSRSGVLITVMAPDPSPAKDSPKRLARLARQRQRREERQLKRAAGKPWGRR